MEFGRVADEDLDKVDFTLPPDGKETNALLIQKKKLKPQIFVGCAKWGRKDWVGKIYPEKTKEADFLNLYSKHFNSIELNATFYKLPTRRQTESWRSQVGNDFLFCPKISRSISHIRRLKNVQEITDRFIDGLSGFGNNLGPVFLQPNPQMGPKSLDTITEFVEQFPHDPGLFLELRHEEWFTNQSALDNIFTTLTKVGAGTVITDASGRRDCLHMRLTKPEAFIRFVGNGLHPTDYTRIDDWVQRIKTWTTGGIEKIYFFMHQHQELHSPELCKYLIQQLNKHCGTTISEPIFVNEKDVQEEKPKK
jgi:uncharacterized protein YecE (DUF72 family)